METICKEKSTSLFSHDGPKLWLGPQVSKLWVLKKFSEAGILQGFINVCSRPCIFLHNQQNERHPTLFYLLGVLENNGRYQVRSIQGFASANATVSATQYNSSGWTIAVGEGPASSSSTSSCHSDLTLTLKFWYQMRKIMMDQNLALPELFHCHTEVLLMSQRHS